MENQFKEPNTSNTESSEQNSQPKVLIIDDELNLCQLMQDTLEEYHYGTAIATGGHFRTRTASESAIGRKQSTESGL